MLFLFLTLEIYKLGDIQCVGQTLQVKNLLVRNNLKQYNYASKHDKS